MTVWQLADKLYAVGYSHAEVRSVWAHAFNEQTLPEAGRCKKRWQAEALEEIRVNLLDIDFGSRGPLTLGNYF